MSPTRILLPLMSLMVIAVAAVPLGSSLGGLVVVGVGEGTAAANDGTYVCPDTPFQVEAIYLPEFRGILSFYWLGVAGPCALLGGGSAALGSSYVNPAATPPVGHVSSCRGNEAIGLECGFIAIGPYGGIGSTLWLRVDNDVERYTGSFVAT